MKINVYEIFNSIDGEVNAMGQGAISTFIRLAGCNLNCPYCDTPKSRLVKNGTKYDVDQLVDMMMTRSNQSQKITITGGEPLLQAEAVTEFISKMQQRESIMFTIETNGSISLFKDCPEELMDKADVCFTMDYKSSTSFNNWSFIEDDSYFIEGDWLKIPIGDKFHLEKPYKKDLIKLLNIQKGRNFQIALSPIYRNKKQYNQLVADVIEFCMAKRISHRVIINTQIHKLIGLK